MTLTHRRESSMEVRYEDERGRLHREDGPARIRFTGEREWYQHGVLQREDGPALVNPDGSGVYHLPGQLPQEVAPTTLPQAQAGLHLLQQEGNRLTQEGDTFSKELRGTWHANVLVGRYFLSGNGRRESLSRIIAVHEMLSLLAAEDTSGVQHLLERLRLEVFARFPSYRVSVVEDLLQEAWWPLMGVTEEALLQRWCPQGEDEFPQQ